MAESENDLLGKTYHLKSSDLDRIQKLISANDSDALQLLNNVDREIGFACGYFSLLETCSFEVTFLDNLISKGKEYSDSDVEFKVRDSLLKVAAELDASNLGNLIPLFKSFDLNSDESYLIKTEQVRNAVEKVFLEILIIKKRTYNQAKSDYLSEHIHCKFYPIKPDGINGVTIDNFWPEKPEETLSSSAVSPVDLPWTFKRVLKYISAFVCIGYMWRYMFTNVWNNIGPMAIPFGFFVMAFIAYIFDSMFSTDQSKEEQETFMEKVKDWWPWVVGILFLIALKFYFKNEMRLR